MKARRSPVGGSSRRQRADSEGCSSLNPFKAVSPNPTPSSLNGKESAQRSISTNQNKKVEANGFDDNLMNSEDKRSRIDEESNQSVSLPRGLSLQVKEEGRITRKRRAKSLEQNLSTSLIAKNSTGRLTTVKVILANRPYTLESPGSADHNDPPGNFVGNDGNQYYCEVCQGFGDVVCCDGCPRVYHHVCVPLESPSRKSLDADEDPWFCPKCMERTKKLPAKTHTKATRQAEKGDRRSAHHRCADCDRVIEGLKLEPCSGCGTYIHSPSCFVEQPALSRKQKVFCSNCLAIDGQAKAEKDEHEKIENLLHSDKPYDTDEKHCDGSEVADFDEVDDDEGDNDDETEGKKKRAKKKKLSVSPNNEKLSEKKRKKKKKKKKKRSLSADGPEDVEAKEQAELFMPLPKTGIVQATPAFHFYLAENRWKIEKSLAREHRYFNRLPKGNERNALVAQEAAAQWLKLLPSEHHRYVTMSMRDFEHRIIEWKNEKVAREMGLLDEPTPGEASLVEDESDANLFDERLTYEKHEKLYVSSSVGSKPFKREPDQSYNRVLLDLLHDMRFHPTPMCGVNRPESETLIDELSAKVTIPHFEIHGPISTSIGDECLGCTRGWAHHCPVLQRRIPAVEHRAKLQPPLSSLIATRIGLGLRPRYDRDNVADNDNMQVQDEARASRNDLFAWQETEKAKLMKQLPVMPSCSLDDPSERADEFVQFIEETTIMKVPEPPRPKLPLASQQQKKVSRLILPTQRNRETSLGDDTISSNNGTSPVYNKCGRCRTIISNDTGCVQCRRAQMVINKSKKQTTSSPANAARPKHEGKMLKAHTMMLARVHPKEGEEETQNAGDAAVSEAMLKERWTPSSILPPQKLLAPSSLRNGTDSSDIFIDDSDSCDEESGDESQESPSILQAGENEDLESIPENAVSEENSMDTIDSPPKKRLRSLRASAVSQEAKKVNRDEILKLHKKEADEIQRKAVHVSTYAIFFALLRRDPLHLFAEPVAAEGYTTLIRNPIDFSRIREKFAEGKYTTLGSFTSDARLLCENALLYNPPSSIYYKTAKEMVDLLSVMQKRAGEWIGVIKDSLSAFLVRNQKVDTDIEEDFLEDLRNKWPEGVRMLENIDTLKNMVEADITRTKENEIAYYGSLAVRRVAAAADSSLAPYPDSSGKHSVVIKRKYYEDEDLRKHVDENVSNIVFPMQLKDPSTWREEAVVRLMRKVQSKRLDRRTVAGNGCSRCDGAGVDEEAKKILLAELSHPGKGRKNKDDADVPRVHASRTSLRTGLGSQRTCERVESRAEESLEIAIDTVQDSCVSVRGSKIHGMGLFADQPFKKGDVVAEYLGEYVTNAVAEEREKIYGERRIQDYQFRLNDKLLIDATRKGGPGRYINHHCNPNCEAKIIPGKEPNEHLRRVMIIALREIEINEEITYDYQFPLELDMAARIPCHCQSNACRGFMNWDLPERGSNNRALLVQKRGANMRDRIRRLGRPLKGDHNVDDE